MYCRNIKYLKDMKFYVQRGVNICIGVSSVGTLAIRFVALNVVFC